ncbi:MAG TPA: integrase family protein [Bradyrhizobium sp.]|uniref:integrase family protein n=1 Tax=Bradyrhizobium sp. TaxID=376 RepID=UPI002BEE4802|nr:integrase family protein [Bradyrhizobium sp.]HLZ06261.1 integrase family protein [Bradyrhizobium sp.]
MVIEVQQNGWFEPRHPATKMPPKTEAAMGTPVRRQEREYDQVAKTWIVRTLNADGTISRREERGPAPKPRRRKSKSTDGAPRPRELTDLHIEALRELCNSEAQKATYYPDNKLSGFFIYVGPRKATWIYRERKSVKGVRRMVFKMLGDWPKIDTMEARKRCAIAMGLTAQNIDKEPEGAPIKFEAAFSAYLDYLKAQAEKKGKPPRWHDNVKKLGDTIILPEYAKWSLIEMSDNPDAVADWHKRVTKKHGPVSANHCARVIRATYKRAARRNRKLPVPLPTSAVDWNDETPSQKALAFKAFPAWLAAWCKIDSAIRQAYHLTGLLTGARPGELARRHWRDYSDNERTLTIGKAKAGKDIVIPVSEEIAAAIKMARADAEALGFDVGPDAPIFPGCIQKGYRDNLPARGNMLRHTYRTVAADLGVDDLISHFLLGHAPKGISQKYIATLILANGPKMRDEQGRMSKQVLKLLKLDAKGLRKAISEALARSRVAGQERARMTRARSSAVQHEG